MSVAHVLVGCGGSGLKTLLRTTELLSQDYYWRKRMAKEIYYVAVDTDMGDLKDFKEKINYTMVGKGDRPYVLPVELSQDVDIIEPIVNRYFREPFKKGTKGNKGRDRLLAHWWNRGADRPFLASRVYDVSRGAGQCPPVSYLLAWKQLDVFARGMTELIREAGRRQEGVPEQINVIFVGSVAGGTGRGCWNVLAMRTRQVMFEKYNRHISPIAFLYGADVFREVWEDDKAFEQPLRVNSLTGLSELSCWISTKFDAQADGEFTYQLPSLVSPESARADTLKSHNPLNTNQSAPVDHAYLILGGNDRTELTKSEDYFEMAGGALYALLSQSSVTSTLVNSSKPYNGVATAMYEVDAPALWRFFEAKQRLALVEKLRFTDERAADQKVVDFFAATKLNIDVTLEDRSLFTMNPDGTFLQRVLARLHDASKMQLASLKKKLEEDDVDEVFKVVKVLCRPDEAKVKAAFKAEIDALAGAPKSKKDDSAKQHLFPMNVIEEFARSLLKDRCSVATVKHFLEDVATGLASEILEMPASLEQREDPIKMAEFFARRLLPMMRHFNAGEQKRLTQAVAAAICTVNYGFIKAELKRQYGAWAEPIWDLKANAQQTYDALSLLRQAFQSQLSKAAHAEMSGSDVASADNMGQSLFAEAAFPEKALPPKWLANHFYRRTLKPVMRAGIVTPEITLTDDLAACIEDSVFAAAPVAATKQQQARFQLRDRLKENILIAAALPSDFIPKHFSMLAVMRGVMEAWQDRLTKTASEEDRQVLLSRFKEFFGFAPKCVLEGGETTYDFGNHDPDGTHVHAVKQMAASLARTCKPFWKIASDTRHFSVSLFVPTERAGGTDHLEQEIATMVADEKIAVSVKPQLLSLDAFANTQANPFVILAYSGETCDTLDDIETLSYYADAGVLDVMQRCEQPDGETIFTGGQNGGLGYVDPLYVRENEIAKHRWKPWVADTDDAIDALVYALFPGNAPSLPKELSQIVAELSAKSWPMPLIKDAGRKRYVFTRRPLLWDDRKAKAKAEANLADLRGWDTDKSVSQASNLHNAYVVLRGDGATGQVAWRTRILDEARLFVETLLPAVNCAKGTARHGQMVEAYRAWLANKGHTAGANDADREVWERMSQRVVVIFG